MTPDLAAEAHAVLARPAIGVHVHAATPDVLLGPVLWGIEEEGIPAAVTRSSELNPLVLAHEAATASRLGVGVGISLDYVVVTTEKLPVGRPYLAARLTRPARQGRIMGTNSARLVRRIPLTSLD
ncbi:MAG: glycerol dehydratase reactivase beta/small subunit family protein [Actinomycetia bacterium]|nr:glycerol dehydratase reactivase beta/small subunit family protein [Actinomycetes bacterium]